MLGLALGAAGLGLGALGSVFGSSAAKKQAQMMQDAINYQKQNWEQAKKFATDQNTQTYGNLAPYREFGTSQLNSLADVMNNKNPSNYIDPGYQFRLNAGTNAIMNNAASRGMAQSGDTLRALAQYGQDMGSQEYDNAFNRWMGEAQTRQGMAGMGQNAVVQGGELGNQTARNLMEGAGQSGRTVGELSSMASQYAGAPDRIWGNFLGGMGGMVMHGASGMLGKGGGMNWLSSLKGPGFGAAAA